MTHNIEPMQPIQINEMHPHRTIPKWVKIVLIVTAIAVLSLGLITATVFKNAITTFKEDGSETKTIGTLSMGQTGESFNAKFTVDNPRKEQGPFNELLCFDVKVENPDTNDKPVSFIPANFTLHDSKEDKSISLLSKNTTLNESTYDIETGDNLQGSICFNLDENTESKYTLGYSRFMFSTQEQLKWKVDFKD